MNKHLQKTMIPVIILLVLSKVLPVLATDSLAVLTVVSMIDIMSPLSPAACAWAAADDSLITVRMVPSTGWDNLL